MDAGRGNMSKPTFSAGTQARDLTHESVVFDCLSLFYVLDDRWAVQCLEAGVNVTNVTFASEQDWDATQRNFEKGLKLIAASSYLRLATCARDVHAARAQGKLAIVIGTQGSRMVDLQYRNLRTMFEMGLRYFGLAYTGATLFADGCGERRNAGLSYAGQELVDAANELKLIVDLSHVGHRSRLEAAQRATYPVCTHSNAYSVVQNDRNTMDDVAKVIADKGGVLGVCGLPRSVYPESPTLGHLMDHADYWKRLLGADRVGLGLDFTEGLKASGTISPTVLTWRTRRPDIFGKPEEFLTQQYPDGLRSIRDLPNLTQMALDRGYGHHEIRGLLGGNWLAHFSRIHA